VNYLYSIFRRVSELNTSGRATSQVWSAAFCFLIFGPGMLLTILFLLLFPDIDAFFWGESTVLVLVVAWIFYPGYKYLPKVKAYSKRTATEVYYLIMAVLVLLYVGIIAAMTLLK
jgi:high-affinity Fe2+/Pb2+ permease